MSINGLEINQVSLRGRPMPMRMNSMPKSPEPTQVDAGGSRREPALAQLFTSVNLTHMIIRTLTIASLAFLFAGCRSVPDMNDPSKETIELTSSDTLPSGPCRIFDPRNRLMLEGTLASGKKDGTWSAWSSQGKKLYMLLYRQDVLNGPVLMWFGSSYASEARGNLMLVGSFLDGVYDGTVIRYYPSGARKSVSVYDHGDLKSSRYWLADGSESSTTVALEMAANDLKTDMAFLAATDEVVATSLAKAQRRIRN